MKEQLINYLKAAYPAVAIRTVEEGRALEVLTSVARETKPGRNLWVWTAGRGIERVHKANDFTFGALDKSTRCVENTGTPGDAAKVVFDETAGCERQEGKDPKRDPFGILVVCDLHTWTGNINPFTERAIKDLLQVAPGRQITVVFLGAEFRIPASFERMVTVMDFELPDRDQLHGSLKAIEDSAKKTKGIKLLDLDNGEREDVLRAATGLTAPEAENAFALAIIESADPKNPKAARKISANTVYREKAAAVRRSGLMEIIEPDPGGLEAVGGLDNLKAWLLQRRLSYSKKARDYGLPSPRGVLVVGPPGCGKSLTAKVVGSILKVPTLRLDLGAMFAGIVGESEARIRAALALADAIAPCVVWCDEIEKSLAGSTSKGDLDSGVGRRILGTMLTWQQERKSDVFMFATANQPWHLPPELMRKGRYDEIFSLTLPTDDEREEIFKIHLKKRGRDPEKFHLGRLAQAADLFTGSECEEAVISGMYAAFEKDEEVTAKHIVAACKATVPLVKTMKEEIDMIEKWGKNRARPASSQEVDMGVKLRRQLGGDPTEEE